MSLEDRVTRLEDAFVHIAEILDQHTGILDRHTTLLEQHSGLLRDIVTLLNAQGDRLDRIERAIRERGQNGQHP